MTSDITKELIDRIFKEPGIKYELTEFESLGKTVQEILDIYPKTVETGRDAGKIKYYLKSLVPFSSGKEEVQVYDVVYAKYWADSMEDMDRQRRKQAEFLVYRFCHWDMVNRIGVLNDAVKKSVERILNRNNIVMPVEVQRQWYY